ncbi:MAG: hypothetical protein ABR915_22400, partial [Thermoguttaceae bacterium]
MPDIPRGGRRRVFNLQPNVFEGYLQGLAGARWWELATLPQAAYSPPAGLAGARWWELATHTGTAMAVATAAPITKG